MLDLHAIIDKNLGHPHYGRLIKHRDRLNPFVYHYSVQLNDHDSLAWEPVHPGREKDTGRIAIWPINWQRFWPSQAHPRDRHWINRALHLSVQEFHENWLYELYRFNCEHWARLVSTGDCRCYQIAQFKKLRKIPVVGAAIVGAAGLVTSA